MPGEMLPFELRSTLTSGKGVLFLGAGIGHNAIRDGGRMPTGSELAVQLATAFDIDTGGSTDLAKVAQVVELRRGRKELNSYLSKRLADYEPDDSLRWLVGLTWRAIFTTNYDRVIERCYELASNPQQKPVTISAPSDFVMVDPRFEIPIYHLHGALYDTPSPHILITEQDYARFRDRRKMLFEVLKQQMATCVIVYAGYSHEDPNWKVVLQEMIDEYSPSRLPPSFRVAPNTPALDTEILNSQGVKTIDGSLTEFVGSASASLGELRVDPSNLDRLRESVPADIRAQFDVNPAPVLRLLNSWTYVNQADFDVQPNTHDFLRGEGANWGVIAGNHHFRRDVEDLAFDSLIDYATAEHASRPTILILAPAGYGTTTVLMSLAVGLVKENAGVVFMHKTGTPIIEGDVEFACSLFKSRPFFLIDNAADYVRAFANAFQAVKNARRAACFLLAERKNEWRQLPHAPKAFEFGIEPLSEPEILRLLECLGQHGELGNLEHLPQDLRIAAIRQKHDRQLLVALREVTEGKAFDAIIESEFRDIQGEDAKHLYATVACAYQLRQPVRDGAVSMSLGLQITEMYESTRDCLEGVVEYELIDQANGIYAARCRHHIIAQIVWERCVAPGERERIMLSLIDALNHNYYVDAQLFDLLIQSDRDVDALGNFEAKTRFFETACKRHPTSPYVRQHYARMLLREGRHELALGEIDAAIKMSPGPRIFYHTRGVILRGMALTTPGLEMGRRRLAQSEDAFREVIRLGKRDAYAYQSLAELFFGWAKRAPTEDEQVAYIDKAEVVITEGLRVVREGEGLWVVSGQIQEWLGHRPQALEHLARAQGSRIAKYILGRLYLRQGDLAKTLQVLEPAIKDDPTDPRIALLYARALIEKGEPYQNSIAVLRLASLYGMRDPAYVATLAGLLFLEGDYSGADRVFSDAARYRFPLEEQERIFFRPKDRDAAVLRISVQGTVSVVRPGYAFIAVQGQPNVFCPWTKAGRLVLRAGQKVAFNLAFTARGAIAEDVQQR